MHESACSIREEKKTPRVFHSPSHFELATVYILQFLQVVQSLKFFLWLMEPIYHPQRPCKLIMQKHYLNHRMN